MTVCSDASMRSCFVWPILSPIWVKDFMWKVIRLLFIPCVRICQQVVVSHWLEKCEPWFCIVISSVCQWVCIQYASASVACFLEKIQSLAVCYYLPALFMLCICTVILPRECPTSVQLLWQDVLLFILPREHPIWPRELHLRIEDDSRAVSLSAVTGALIFPGTISSGLFLGQPCCSSCRCSWPGMQPLVVAAAVSALFV